MPKYKLKYFSIQGIAVARFLFAIAKEDHEDIRVTLDEWPAIKPDTPLGQLPVLEVDGEKIPQMNAITRHLARTFGFYGDTDLEKSKIDVVLEVVNDLAELIRRYYYEKDKTRKEDFYQQLKDNQAPRLMRQLETLLEFNDDGNGFFVGKKISLADITVFTWIYDRLPYFEITNDEPKLQALVNRIRAMPEVDDWLKKRPETDKQIE